eukprot:gene16099-17720_t
MSCIHLLSGEDYSIRARSILRKSKENKQNVACSICKMESSSFLVCLQKHCGFIGCETEETSHFMNHAQQILLDKMEFLSEDLKPKGNPALTQFFLKCEQFSVPGIKEKPNVVVEYRKLISTMWDEERERFVSPTALARSFRIAYPQFRGYSQQDSQEFLRCLMDRLHEELKRPVMTSPSMKSTCSQKSNHNRNNKKLLAGSNSAEENTATTHHSIISDVFNGRLTSSVQCSACHRISTTLENFQDLSLPIPGKDDLQQLHTHSGATPHVMSLPSETYERGWFSSIYEWLKSWVIGPQVSLQDCLAAFFAKDELKGDNMYNCEKCNKLRNGVKYLRVLSLPETLCIHLKRFRHEMSYSTKINNFVKFPVNGLDLRNFIGQDCTSQCTIYDLCAVITHYGTVGSGHYVAYAKNCVNNKWYEFNDSFVTETSEYDVENTEAYCLFYTKRSLADQMHYRAHAREKVNLSGVKDGVFVSKEWLTRFETCCEPGEISNYDFLCPHGDVSPDMLPRIKKFFNLIPRDLWKFLHSRFGGGPEVTSLSECIACKELAKRRDFESKRFRELNEDFQKDPNPEMAYCLSIAWYKQWDSFTKGEQLDPPGPIDNSDIIEKNADQINVKEDSNHGLVSEETWNFFEMRYGGGPELKINKKPKEDEKPNGNKHVDSDVELTDQSDK